MRVILSLTLLLSLCFIGLCREIKNVDKPLKGYWDFKMKKVWTLEEAGNEVFTVIDALKCTDKGTVYVMDRKHFKVFIISKKGEYLSSFGKRGDGPGELTTLRSLYLLNDLVIVVDDRNIHYFSSKGKHIKSVLNNHINLSPVSFVTPDKFICVTAFTGADNLAEMGAISIYDIKKKENKKLFEFPKYKKGAITSRKKSGDVVHTTVYSFSVSSLTPGMVLYHKKDKLYFGMNNEYRIRVADLDGNEIFHFILERERKKVSDQYKDDAVKGFDFPEEIKKLARKNLPDYLNYFEKIYVDDYGFIYIFQPGREKRHQKRVDIFSSKGKYLYKSKVEVEPGFSLKSVYIEGGSMYIIKLGEDDSVLLSKYNASMPK